jgi:hypothetical protein
MTAHVTGVKHHEFICITQVPSSDSIKHASLATDAGTLLIQRSRTYQFKLAHVNSEVFCETASKSTYVSRAFALA